MKALLKLALILCLCTACSRHSNTGTLALNLAHEPATLDWNKASDAFSFDVISNLMIGLTRYAVGEQGAIAVEPAIAETWQIDAEQDAYTFKLNPKACWHDGVPVVAQHFVDSFRRTLDPMTAAPYAELLSMIDLEQTKAIDAHTLYIKLKKPAPYFIYMTAYGLMLPIRLDLINQHGNKWTNPGKLITNGPYKLSKWQHEYKIELERADNYFGKPAKIPRIKFFMVAEQSQAFTLFKNHQIDFVDGRSLPSSELRNIESNLAADERLLRAPLLRSTYIGFNNRNVDLHLRKALSYAIDRRAVTAALQRGYQPSASWIPSGLPEYFHADLADPDQAFNPELARAELKLAKNQNSHLVFAFPSTEEAKLISETLQSMWRRELGITVELRSMEWKVYLSTLETNPPDIFRLNWSADYPDPDSFMQIFMTKNPMNYPGWFNSDYDALMARAATLSSQNLSERQNLYLQAEKMLLRDFCVIAPIFTNTQTIVHRANLHGLVINSMDIAFLDRITKDE